MDVVVSVATVGVQSFESPVGQGEDRVGASPRRDSYVQILVKTLDTYDPAKNGLGQ